MDLIRVGDFELYPSERMLSVAGKPLELGARAFDLLLVLVEHHGHLVTKATLLERVWPRIIVDENNLPAQVASLRRVLGAGAIRTVPGFGYRLELEVSPRRSTEEAPAPIVRASEREPLRLSMARRAWPNRLGPLVGREDDVRDVQEALGRSCLVTVVGIAGVGKTRLAQEILAREAEKPGAAVAWVSLGPLDAVQHVPSAIALALGLPLPDGVDGFVALCQALENVPLLLILDCADQLGDALATPLAELISQTQGVRALVTSQAPLGIAGETVYRLSVLPVPDPSTPQADAVRYASVALFAQRAAAADRRFELCVANTSLVAEICRRLDGIPLALELAAARVPALGLAALLERLDDRFRLLRPAGRPPDPRHGALHTAFDWSYGLLAPAEQRVFNRLGTFAGSFSLKAAARCVADETIDTCEAIDLIGRLVDRSLVTALTVNPPRYTLLETARYYALERLAANDELQVTRERMAATMLELLDLAYQEYWSLDEAIWLHRYEPELDNVRAAMEWATANDRALGVALFGSAWPLFVETDLYAEGRARYTQGLPLLSDALPRARVGRFWEAIATYDSTRQCDRARYAAELAAEMHAATSDIRSHYYALMQLAFNWRVDTAAARSAFEVARTLEDPAWPARLLTHGALTEGALLMNAGQFVDARAAYQRAMRLALTTSERQALAATVNIVELDIACGNTAAALQLGRPLALSLRHLGRRETRFELLVMTFSALLLAGEIDEARATGAELYELVIRLDTGKLYTVLDAMAFLACEERRYDAAARIAICADVAHEAHGQVRRRPAEERMRTAVATVLTQHLGPAWHSATCDSREQLDEMAACSLALGLCA
ncbi:MAG: putative ATPase [Gammaproteobacteria bacterium]|nr:putative ATPase [Gammaproteobacteria bacterium]